MHITTIMTRTNLNTCTSYTLEMFRTRISRPHIAERERERERGERDYTAKRGRIEHLKVKPVVSAVDMSGCR